MSDPFHLADVNGRERARRLADLLREQGLVPDLAWHAALAGVPRHVFVPRFYEQEVVDGWYGWKPIDPGQEDQFGAWLDGVYSDRTLITQITEEDLGDRPPKGLLYGEATSSGTLPSLLLRMLDHLGVGEGHRVLDVGTGTGYLTALLCARLGDQHVASVDIDPHIVNAARARLAAIGHHPRLAVGDGLVGYPPGAPYDRIIATCATTRIPPAWIDQLVPGGVVVTDIRGPLGGNLARIHRNPTPGHASGGFLDDPGGFMPARGPGHPNLAALLNQVSDADAPGRPTDLRPDALDAPAFAFLAQLHLSGTGRVEFSGESGPVTYLLSRHGAWAAYRHHDHTVAQHGNLWDTLEHAHRFWTDAGQPNPDRYGITITPDRQTVWLDTPDGPVWDLPT